jgi:hypothetical protein
MSVYLAVGISMSLVNGIGCGKKTEEAPPTAAAPPTPKNKVDAPTPVITTVKRSAPNTQAPQKPVLQKPIPEITNTVPALTPLPATSAGSTAVTTLPPVDNAPKAPPKNSKAKDSDENKTKDLIKVSFVDLKTLSEIGLDSKAAIYKGKKISQEEGMKLLLHGDEEQFCQVTGSETMNSDDYLLMFDGDSKLIDKDNNIYNSKMLFKNTNGTLTLSCFHTSSHFFMEEIRITMKGLLTLHYIDKSSENPSFYENPETQNRRLQAIQIKNMDLFNKVTVYEANTEDFALKDETIVPIEKAFNEIAAGEKGQIACYVSFRDGDIKLNTTYVGFAEHVDLGADRRFPVSKDFHYRSGKDSYFILTCRTTANFSWDSGDIFKLGKEVFQFGLLHKKELYAKQDEMVNFHKEFIAKQKELMAKQKVSERKGK